MEILVEKEINLTDLEKTEYKYYEDCISGIGANLSSKLGLQTKTIRKSFAYSFSHYDILAFNRILGFGLDFDVTGKDIEHVIDFYNKTGARRFFVPVSPVAKPLFLEQMLEQKGFIHYNNWSKLYKKLNEPEIITDSKIEINIASKLDKESFSTIIQNSFDWPLNVAAIFSQTIGKKGWIHYIATIDNQSVGAAAMFCRTPYASLVIAATLPRYRGIGIQSNLIKRRINDAIQSNCRFAVVETGENKNDDKSSSFRNLERQGFKLAYLRKNYIYNV